MNQQVFDYNKLCKEAQVRWLKPPEIFYTLQNYERYPITPEAPQKPPSGSLFLFNKRVLRYFRKDGHSWRKKKDGRNIGEAHERLKVGNADALNCYYAHGEQNPYFQRRSYWMLDPAYEHIVLVHYREVSEGRFLYGSNLNMSTDSSSTFNQSTSAGRTHYQGITSGNNKQCDPNGHYCNPGTVEEVTTEFSVEKSNVDHLHTIKELITSDLSPQPEVTLALRKLAVQLSLEDADDENTIYFGRKLPAFPSEYHKPPDLEFLDNKTGDSLQESHENLFHGMEYWEHKQTQSEKQCGYGNKQLLDVSGDKRQQVIQTLGSGYNVETRNCMLKLSSSSAPFNACGRRTIPPNILESSMLRPSAYDQTQDFPFEQPEQFSWSQHDHGGNNAECRTTQHPIQQSTLDLQLSATGEVLLAPENPIETVTPVSLVSRVQIQSTCATSVYETASDKFRKQNSTDWMAAIDLDVNNTFSPDFSAMWFERGQFDIPVADNSSLPVVEKQKFSIREISPEWAFSSENTKVIIIGDFPCNSSELPMVVIFGSIQVPAEIVQEGVLRCMTPQHGDGKVTLCVASGNRGSCSEVKEFEFRAKPTTSNSGGQSFTADAANNSEELWLLVRFVHMLLSRSEGSPALQCGSGRETEDSSALKPDARWSQVIEASFLEGSEVPAGTIDWVMQELLKDKLQQWLSKYQGEEPTKQEQGIIHMISGLGYKWALILALNSGVGVNFRDANGWTALHWAARFGREEVVAALLAAGASAGAVTDPTPQDPVGKTAGAIAAANGHLGLAGYLSEADLTSHPSLLATGEGDISKGPTEVEAERAVESISQRSFQLHVGGMEDELSLKDSLAAVRNATQAAARIQAAFRAHSFRKRRQITATSEDEYGLTLEDVHGLLASPKYRSVLLGSRDQNFDKAALSIQKKYRGWKGRKDFSTLRQHAVKIQAHVRGYQERKKYKVLVWTVGVLEKIVLRWLRKDVGLRGYRVEPELIDVGDEDVEDLIKVFRKQKVDAAVDQAVSRVLSMVDSPTARKQYRRMLEGYQQAKAELSPSEEAPSKMMARRK